MLLTAADVDNLCRALLESTLPPGTVAALTAKLRSTPTPGADARALEEALIRAARGKVLRLAGGSGYARLSRQGAQLGATPADMAVLGSWLADQAWFDTGTALGVLAKWAEWLPRARAWHDKNLRPGATGPGAPPPGGRPAPGFR